MSNNLSEPLGCVPDFQLYCEKCDASGFWTKMFGWIELRLGKYCGIEAYCGICGTLLKEVKEPVKKIKFREFL